MFIGGHIGLSVASAKLINRCGHKSLINNWWIFIVGALFPDFIDKPLSLIFHNNRTICHTLWFLILVVVVGLVGYLWCHQKWLLVFSLGAILHIVFDQAWQDPNTFLWPFYGPFEQHDRSWWSLEFLIRPGVYVPEIIGWLVVAWLGIKRLARSLNNKRAS